MPRLALFSLALLAAAGACSRDGPALPETTPMPATLPGVYAGELPCGNCAAIAATLWLRPDGRFVLRQRFGEGARSSSGASGPETTYGLGRWSWDEHAAEAVLRGAGPARRLAVRDAERVELIVASPVEHVLARQPDAAPFGDRLTLDGESAVTKDGATFTECLTGLSFAVDTGGAYRELRRQHQRMNPRGKVALTTVEAHIVTLTDGEQTREALVVDRFVTMKPGTPCPSR